LDPGRTGGQAAALAGGVLPQADPLDGRCLTVGAGRFSRIGAALLSAAACNGGHYCASMQSDVVAVGGRVVEVEGWITCSIAGADQLDV
jgi:hypothetical protein